jgi:hypothetical protein
MRTVFAAALVSILSATVCGCGKEPLRVVQIQLGRSLNSDSTVAGTAFKFKTHDTIYLSVMTAGKGSGTISVRWMYGSRVIDEPKKQVHYAYKDTMATDFRLEAPGGFPPGEYTAEVSLDGQPAGTKKFRVE